MDQLMFGRYAWNTDDKREKHTITRDRTSWLVNWWTCKKKTKMATFLRISKGLSQFRKQFESLAPGYTMHVLQLNGHPLLLTKVFTSGNWTNPIFLGSALHRSTCKERVSWVTLTITKRLKRPETWAYHLEYENIDYYNQWITFLDVNTWWKVLFYEVIRSVEAELDCSYTCQQIN